MASVLALAQLSEAVYATDGGLDAGKVTGYAVDGKDGNPNAGFYAVFFKGQTDGEGVLAIRGTDLTDTDDLSSDRQLASGAVPAQYAKATAFLGRVKDKMGGRAFFLTGHSLGGGLASMLAAKSGLPVVTFNAPGMKNSVRTAFSAEVMATSGKQLTAQQQSEFQISARQKVEQQLSAINTTKMLNIRASGDVVSVGTGPAIGPVESIVVPEGASGWAGAAAAVAPILGAAVAAGSYAAAQHSITNVCRAISQLPKYKINLQWANAPVVAPAAPAAKPTKFHTVAAGDTLAKIAQIYYRDPKRWTVIYAVPSNRTAIGSNPDWIRPGLRLEIPA